MLTEYRRHWWELGADGVTRFGWTLIEARTGAEPGSQLGTSSYLYISLSHTFKKSVRVGEKTRRMLGPSRGVEPAKGWKVEVGEASARLREGRLLTMVPLFLPHPAWRAFPPIRAASTTDPLASLPSILGSKGNELPQNDGNSTEHRHDSLFIWRKCYEGDVDWVVGSILLRAWRRD